MSHPTPNGSYRAFRNYLRTAISRAKRSVRLQPDRPDNSLTALGGEVGEADTPNAVLGLRADPHYRFVLCGKVTLRAEAIRGTLARATLAGTASPYWG